jgi:precorrin-6B methylase 1
VNALIDVRTHPHGIALYLVRRGAQDRRLAVFNTLTAAARAATKLQELLERDERAFGVTS